MEDVASAGQRCNSVCCTGAFVAEAMLAVVLGPDVKRLDFDLRRRAREKESPAGRGKPFWNKNKILQKYVNFQVSVLVLDNLSYVIFFLENI